MISAVSLGLLALLEAQTYHNFHRSGANRSRFKLFLTFYVILCIDAC